jgi:ATP-dependent Clp protease protease subunit
MEGPMPQSPPAARDPIPEDWIQALRPLEAALFRARKIFLYGEINQGVARSVTERLIAMAASGEEPITLFINSQGGHVEAGDTIHDMIGFVKPRVKVVGTGWVASAGAHIYLAPPKRDRFCLPNTRFMLHQPHGGVYGQAVDIGIEAQEIVKMRQRLNQTIARQTGQPLERVQKDTDRNFWMSAETAVEYGVVGRIVQSQEELEGV